MTLTRRKKCKRCLFSKPKRLTQNIHKGYFQSIFQFLEVEKPTFNFIKLLSVFFFTLEMGVLATLFNSYTSTLLFFCFALITSISFFYLFLSLSNFMKSLFSIIDSDNQFFLYRKIGHKYLNISIYTCLFNFVMACFIYSILLST